MTGLKENYKNKYSNIICPICKKDGDTQSHLMVWSELASELNFLSDELIEYVDMFSGNLKKQANTTKLFEKLYEVRKSSWKM